MTYEGLFTLLDDNDTIIEKFEPLTAISQRLCCWTSDSTHFAVAVGHFQSGFLIVRLPQLDFSFLKFANPYLDISFQKDKFVVGYNDEQVALTNSTQTFGGGVLEIPTKTMIKPDDLRFGLSDLNFYSRQQLNDFTNIIKSAKEYNLELIDGGYKEFKGIFPQNTKQVYNTRQFEIYQLEAFAEYGDKKSQEWLDNDKAKDRK